MERHVLLLKGGHRSHLGGGGRNGNTPDPPPSMTDLVLGGSDPPPSMTDLVLGGSDPPPSMTDLALGGGGEGQNFLCAFGAATVNTSTE